MTECLTYSTAQKYNLGDVFSYLREHYRGVKKLNEVVFLQTGKKYVYVFSFGAVIFWGFPEDQALLLIQSIQPYSEEPVKANYENEAFAYKMGTKTIIDEREDMIILERDKDALYILALSYALGQSVKLMQHEKELKMTVDKLNFVPKSLAENGKTTLKTKEIFKKIGILYLQKWSIHSVSFRKTPRDIWENPEIAQYYTMASEFLDLQARIKTLNHNLTMIEDLLEILGEQVDKRHSTMLEWVIILLISAEILLVIFKDIFHLVN